MMRWFGRAAVAVGVVAAGIVVGVAPAAADDDELRLRLPERFTAGGPPDEITMEINRGEGECVSASMLFLAELAGAAEGQFQAAVRDGGQWRPLRVSFTGEGRFVTEPVAPDDPRVCGDDQSRASVLLQISFAAGVPGGEATFAGQAYTETGELMDATDESREVRGGRATPSPSASGSPSSAAPVPAADATSDQSPAEPVGQPAAEPPVVAGIPVSEESVRLGSGALLMAAGVGLVGLGVGLLIVLVRRGRRDSGGDDDPPVTRVRPRIVP